MCGTPEAAADAVDVALQGLDRPSAPLYASTTRCTSRPLTWTGLSLALDVTSSPWTTRNLLVGAVDGVEAVDVGEEVVIGQHQELVAVLRYQRTTSSGVLSPPLLMVCVCVLPLYQRIGTTGTGPPVRLAAACGPASRVLQGVGADDRGGPADRDRAQDDRSTRVWAHGCPLLQNRKRAASCIVRGPPMVEVIRPAVPQPLAANVDAGLAKTGVFSAL